MRPSSPLAGLGGDLRRARRLMIAAPFFTAVAVGTVALGVGANTAIFSVIDAVLLEPLPYRKPDRLAVILQRGGSPVSPANLFEWRESSTAFEQLAAAELWSATLTGVDEPERLTAVRVTPELFPVLGVRPAIGRLPGPGDELAGDAGPVVLSHRLWRRRFGTDPGIVGQRIVLNGVSREVIGVMPADFRFPPFWATGAELWAPLPLAARATSRAESLRIFGRLASGVSVERARAEMATITARLESAMPGTNKDIEVTALTDRVVGGVRSTLWLLAGAVGFVLLIACANVAHLLMARAEHRRREVAVRAALGASRWRLGRQLAVESGLLALVGGALGLLLARLAVAALAALGPTGIPRLDDVRIDGTVLAFALALSFLTGTAFGVAPALAGSRVDLSLALKATAARGATGDAHQRRWRDWMVASQFALAVVLLVGAGLSIRSFAARLEVDAGFDPTGVTSMVVSVAGTRSGEPARRAGFYREVVDRIARSPGISAVSAINHLPLAGDFWSRSYQVEGRAIAAPGEESKATYRVVMPGYFETVRLPLLAGRDFGDDDAIDRPGTVIVNEAMARREWPGEDPIGRRITLDDPANDPTWLTVVGVSATAVRSEWTAGPAAEIYLPWAQSRLHLEHPNPAFAYLTLVIRTTEDPATTAALVRRVVGGLDRDVPVSEVQTLSQVVAAANAEPRFTLFLLTAFAGLALMLAAVGVYGVMSYSVARRTREIGIRMTLGANRGRIIRMIVGRSVGVALAGALAGVVVAIGLTRFMAGSLYRVTATDPITFATVPGLLIMVAVTAALVPAGRATRIDPAAAARGDDES